MVAGTGDYLMLDQQLYSRYLYFTKVYVQGQQAYLNGLETDDCPYRMHTEEWQEWHLGFRERAFQVDENNYKRKS